MAFVLKVACQGQIHQFDLGSDPDYVTVDAALRKVSPGMASGSAKYIDPEGDLCTLVESTFRDFIVTSSMLAGPSDQVVLNLLLPAAVEQAPRADASVAAIPVGPQRRHRRCLASPQAKAAWEEDDRDLEELLHEICGTEEELGPGSRARHRRQRPKRKARAGLQESQQTVHVPSVAGHVAKQECDKDESDAVAFDKALILGKSPRNSMDAASDSDGSPGKHEACKTRDDVVDANARWQETFVQLWDAEEEAEDQPWELGGTVEQGWGMESWNIGNEADHDWGTEGGGWNTEHTVEQGWNENSGYHHNIPVLRLPARRSMVQVPLMTESEEETEEEDALKLPVRSASCPARLTQPLQTDGRTCQASGCDIILSPEKDAADRGTEESVSDDGHVATTFPPWPATPEFTPPSSSRCAVDSRQVIWVPMQMWVPVLPLVQSC